MEGSYLLVLILLSIKLGSTTVVEPHKLCFNHALKPMLPSHIFKNAAWLNHNGWSTKPLNHRTLLRLKILNHMIPPNVRKLEYKTSKWHERFWKIQNVYHLIWSGIISYFTIPSSFFNALARSSFEFKMPRFPILIE